jgi:acyl phosphate:glycerol-3-phosphate acyltransferase
VTAAAVGYLCGSFPSADIASRVATRGDVDLRAAGSGNPGGLNAMKMIGKKWGTAVIVADMAKGTVAGLAGRAIAGDAGAYAAATASIAGHIAPPWSNFKGGKGVATSAGACLAVFPVYFPIDAAVAAVGTVGSRNPDLTVRINGAVWIGAAALWSVAKLPNAWGPKPGRGLVAFSVVGTAMILAKFRAARPPAVPA